MLNISRIDATSKSLPFLEAFTIPILEFPTGCFPLNMRPNLSIQPPCQSDFSATRKFHVSDAYIDSGSDLKVAKVVISFRPPWNRQNSRSFRKRELISCCIMIMLYPWCINLSLMIHLKTDQGFQFPINLHETTSRHWVPDYVQVNNGGKFCKHLNAQLQSSQNLTNESFNVSLCSPCLSNDQNSPVLPCQTSTSEPNCAQFWGDHNPFEVFWGSRLQHRLQMPFRTI